MRCTAPVRLPFAIDERSAAVPVLSSPGNASRSLMIVAYMHALPTLFFNGLWQRYISSRCVVFPTSFLQRRAEQRRVFAPPCVHPRAGRQCIALTKRKACRASLLWAKRRRGGAVWSSLTSTKAGEFKTKLKINHLRSSPGPPELAGFYVDSVIAQTHPT